MYNLLRPVLFQLDSETAHNLSMNLMRTNNPILKAGFKGLSPQKMRPAKSAHMEWRHAIGLAAGFDKDAKALDFLTHLGFGAIEVGTITLKPQVGNARPRIWRMKDQNALRNAMGFPSGGSEAVLPRVKKYKGPATLGVNIGKNKDTPLEDAAAEYLELYKMFADHCDYVVINVSSPNTADLRQLQEKAWLQSLLKPFTTISDRKPLYLKISPDESEETLQGIVSCAQEFELSGLIATNTSADHEFDKGGISGDVIFDRSKAVWSKLLANASKDFDIIAVGGFSKAEQFEEYFDLGGKFAQVYTGFVYQGPDVLDLTA